MVSDFVEERDGYLALILEQYNRAKLSNLQFSVPGPSVVTARRVNGQANIS